MKPNSIKTLFSILLSITVTNSYAYPLNDTTHISLASSLPASSILHLKYKAQYLEDSLYYAQGKNNEEENISDLARLEEDYNKSSNNPKAMIRLLKTMKVKRAFRNKKYKARLYDDLATISARLKLYPLAMQYHYQTMELESSDSNIAAAGSTWEEPGSGNTALLNTDTLEINNYSNKEKESIPITADEITQSFEDGKTATEFALILHVKQPSPGKRKAFTGIDNVGHMFITLIKYNSDHSFVCRSFGFYPDKNNFFAATPLHPAAPPVFKDDALHDWDEAIGKFISHKRFIKIIKLLTRYEYKVYNLNQNNCTDFGLTIASLSGISITDTKGKWPLGKGNNPANAGQSILEGKFHDEDGEEKNELFILNGINPFITKLH